MFRVLKGDRFGLVRPSVDAHTLGMISFAQVLADCGYPAIQGDAAVCAAVERPEDPEQLARFVRWLREHDITVLGFSYRLDPADGAERLGRWLQQLRNHRLLAESGGPVRAVLFAGLPSTCDRVQREFPNVAAVFRGDETPAETLHLLGIDARDIPRDLAEGLSYDADRFALGQELIRHGRYEAVPAVDRRGYPGFGSAADTLVARLDHGRRHGLAPLMRAHVGPYGEDRQEVLSRFLEWSRLLAASGLLDVLSIGTSQLTQSDFGSDWTGRPNGGGVPINSPGEFAAVWAAARPMLVRTYAGTRNIPALARLHEETLHIAWHALSLWWFCRIDGRGPYTVLENLEQHVETLRYAAVTGKPYEPNIAHHFAFRGADDVTGITSALLAVRLAKAVGIRTLVLQVMLNTPKATWGIQDLAKARALLRLTRELEDDTFRLVLQPRAGLDYFSHQPDKARAQLAAATMLMDDIEPHDPASPSMIHVVSFSEGYSLADPSVVDESVRITRAALTEYREARARGDVPDMGRHGETEQRTEALVDETRALVRAIESAVPDWMSAGGLYRVLALGFLPVPYLWECREEFTRAVRWQTRLVRGAVRVVDTSGKPLTPDERVHQALTIAAGTGGEPGAKTPHGRT